MAEDRHVLAPRQDTHDVTALPWPELNVPQCGVSLGAVTKVHVPAFGVNTRMYSESVDYEGAMRHVVSAIDQAISTLARQRDSLVGHLELSGQLGCVAPIDPEAAHE